jgi:hypothetical protein
VAKNMDNTLLCIYGSDAGCLALLNATLGGPAKGRIQQGEVSGYWFLKVTVLILSSIKHPRPPRLSGSRWRAGSIQYLPILT